MDRHANIDPDTSLADLSLIDERLGGGAPPDSVWEYSDDASEGPLSGA
jgi:hypothetical protein